MLLKIKSFASHTLMMSMCTEFCNLLNSERKGLREITKGNYPWMI
jgi:hypothetical protein